MRWLASFPNFASGTAAAAALGCALAGCSAPSAPDAGQSGTGQSEAQSDAGQARDRMVMAETAWLSVSREGEVYTTFLDADGRYRDLVGGALAFAGRWEQSADGELCFEPDSGTAACWDHDAPQPDGVMRATEPDGRTIELKRIAYRPPLSPSPSAPSAPVAGTGDAGAQAEPAAGSAQSGGG